MKHILKVLPVLVLATLFFSCSDDQENPEEKVESKVDLDVIIGEWMFISEHSYHCDTDEIETERYPGGVINTFTFNADGTYELIEASTFSESGLWEKNEDGTYKITEQESAHEDELSTYDIDNRFEGNDILQWGYYGCQEDDYDPTTYVYARFDRIK